MGMKGPMVKALLRPFFLLLSQSAVAKGRCALIG